MTSLPALPADAAKQAVEFLFQLCGDRIDLVAIPLEGRLRAKTFPYSARARTEGWIAKHNSKANLYFQVNSVKNDVRDRKARREDIDHVRMLHVDIDSLEGLERILKFPFKPSAVVASGNGYHSYYKLSTPSVDMERCEASNKALAHHLEGDKSTFDVPRLLRVPYTINLPTEKKRREGKVPVLAAVVHELTDFTRVYELTAFESFNLPGADQAPKTVVGVP